MCFSLLSRLLISFAMRCVYLSEYPLTDADSDLDLFQLERFVFYAWL